MSKVVLPKKVAESINNLRLSGERNGFIVCAALGDSGDKDSNVLYDFVQHNDDNFDKLLNALANGYDVEKSPEEELAEYYRLARMQMEEWGSDFDAGILAGVRQAVEILRLEIAGIEPYTGEERSDG